MKVLLKKMSALPYFRYMKFSEKFRSIFMINILGRKKPVKK